MASPFNALTEDYCNRRGWQCLNTEHFDTGLRRSFDLWGLADYIVIDDQRQTIAVQVTGNSQRKHAGNANARIKKICTECRKAALSWLCGASNLIQVWSWEAGVLIKHHITAEIITCVTLKTSEAS